MVTNLLRSRSPTGAAAPPGAGLFMARRGSPEIVLPVSAWPVAVLSGAASTFGSWVSLGTPASDLYLSSVWACLAAPPNNAEAVLVELARDAGYVPVEAVRCGVVVIDPTSDSQGYPPFPRSCRSMCVPAGEELWARSWAQIASQTVQVAVAGWSGSYPTWDVLPANTVTGPGRYYPSNTSVGVFVTPAVWPAWGTPLTIVDPAPNDLLVVEVGFTNYGSDILVSGVVVEVGYGPAGSETWCAMVWVGHGTRSAWVWPPVWVKAGERLAVRAQCGNVTPKQLVVKVYDL